MSEFKLPIDGLTVIHDPIVRKDSTNKDIPQILQLNLVENITKDILKSLRNNEQVRLKLGKKSNLQYGRKQLGLNHISDSFSTEVFTGPLDGSEPVYFSGTLSHTLEVQKANEDTAKSVSALAALENTLKTMKEQAVSNEASFLGNKNDARKKDIKSASLNTRDRLRGTATPSSPFLGASPRLGPTSNPLLSSTPTKEKIRQDAMRIPMVHLLAMNPMTPAAIARRLNAPQADCNKVLEKVAKDGNAGKKELKEKCFRELDVWKFPYQADEDRQAAIIRAIHAYDRLRIDKSDQLWQLLLPKDERGKGKVLSRLNFERPPPAVVTPRLGPDVDGKAEMSDKEGKAKKPIKSAPDTKEPMHKKKASTDTIVRKQKTEKAPVRSAAAIKAESKYKSSERIEDSDEEAETVEVAPAKPILPMTHRRDTKAAPSPRLATNTHVNGQHKSKLSNASASSSDLDRVRLHEDRTKLKPRPKPERSPTASRISPRPRVDSSPQKPSPLGSSPPTNSTDLENSSKSSTQSSAPSSPPSSTDTPLLQTRRNYSPVIASKGRNALNQSKRKGEKGEEPPAKRQQVHGLGLSKNLTEKLQQPTPERRPSDSSVSSPEKPAVTKESVIDATLKFQEYYAKYKALHAKLDRQDLDDRTDKDLDQLWKMHERLDKIKSELWSDWAKAGGEMPL